VLTRIQLQTVTEYVLSTIKTQDKFFHQPIFCQTCNLLTRRSNQQRLSKICENAHISYVHSRVILLCKSKIRTKDSSVGGMYCQFLFSNYIMSPSKRKGKKTAIILSLFEVTVYFRIDPF